MFGKHVVEGWNGKDPGREDCRPCDTIALSRIIPLQRLGHGGPACKCGYLGNDTLRRALPGI